MAIDVWGCSQDSSGARGRNGCLTWNAHGSARVWKGERNRTPATQSTQRAPAVPRVALNSPDTEIVVSTSPPASIFSADSDAGSIATSLTRSSLVDPDHDTNIVCSPLPRLIKTQRPPHHDKLLRPTGTMSVRTIEACHSRCHYRRRRTRTRLCGCASSKGCCCIASVNRWMGSGARGPGGVVWEEERGEADE